MSRTTVKKSPVVRAIRSNIVAKLQEEFIDVTSTSPGYEEDRNSLGGSILLKGNSENPLLDSSNDSNDSPSFFTPNHHQLLMDNVESNDTAVKETPSNMLLSNTTPEIENLDPGEKGDYPDKCYSQSMSSMLLNLDAINSQETRNVNPTGILERSLTLNPKETIITEILHNSQNTSTIRHVLECNGRTHRILARLVDVYPKELSKVSDTGSCGLALVLKDKSECTLRARINDSSSGIQQFFDHFQNDLSKRAPQVVLIGALFEYILRKFPLFDDYVIHEEQIPENTFLLDLCISSTGGEDESYEIINSRLNRHFMIDFCWYLLNSNEDILKEM